MCHSRFYTATDSQQQRYTYTHIYIHKVLDHKLLKVVDPLVSSLFPYMSNTTIQNLFFTFLYSTRHFMVDRFFETEQIQYMPFDTFIQILTRIQMSTIRNV